MTGAGEGVIGDWDETPVVVLNAQLAKEHTSGEKPRHLGGKLAATLWENVMTIERVMKAVSNLWKAGVLTTAETLAANQALANLKAGSK